MHLMSEGGGHAVGRFGGVWLQGFGVWGLSVLVLKAWGVVTFWRLRVYDFTFKSLRVEGLGSALNPNPKPKTPKPQTLNTRPLNRKP